MLRQLQIIGCNGISLQHRQLGETSIQVLRLTTSNLSEASLGKQAVGVFVGVYRQRHRPYTVRLLLAEAVC